MDAREKLVELLDDMQRSGTGYFGSAIENKKIADYLIKHGVMVQECKVAEIDQFKLPIDDTILILKEEYKQRVDGYTTHLSYGGNGDPAEEVHIDALKMAIAALELQKQTFSHRRKEND